MNLQEYADSLRGKRVAVLGLGVSNTPLVQFLLRNGIEVSGRDKSDREKIGDRANKLEEEGAKLFLGDEYLENLTEDVIFRTPGIRPDLPQITAAVERGAVLTSEMEAFFEVCPCRILAVTGSDGKTTTTTILSELLKAAGRQVFVGGNIGTPLFTKAGEMKPEDLAVLELSSFQLMTMKKSPSLAVVTNLAPNHLDVHKSMEEYTRAKMNIFLHQGKNGVAVLNADNSVTATFPPACPGEVRTFSRRGSVSHGYYALDGVIYRKMDGKTEPILREEEIFLPGKHNVENYLAAFCAADGLVSADVMRSVARTFKGVEHRIEHVRTLDGVDYYNDSIASSPSRTIAGLRSFPQKVILIAGGKDKGVPFDELGREILLHVKKLVLTGYTAEKIHAAVENAPGYAGDPPIIITDGFDEAIWTARKLAHPGDVVILSPACTSFDRFKNFAERGRRFKEIVNEME